ncbi:TRAP transporter small permease [Salipiger mucosus]|uniref:TRAP transporter small permease protein n=1 Tax=Salipiger mucosus DSM 16094 TaxID=1123237 RepID=S9S4L2_9RHOB|nr:TRAP transporter small permease [Salipiger mucosus]EPX85105.1 TRAP C4-dicarboxylate transport system permease DctM subunit [Salipiger mucosus DSM 16094]
MNVPGVFGVFCRAGAVLCGLLLLVFTGLVLYSVVMRYLFTAPPMWGEELPKLLFVWMIFLGAGFAYFGGLNIRMTALIDLVPRGPRRVIEIAMHLTVVAMLLGVLWYSVPIIKLTSRSVSYATGLSEGWKFWALPIGASLLLINEAVRLRRLFRGEVDEPVAIGPSPNRADD